MNPHRPGPFIVLTGPTGVGKTDKSLALAQTLDAEIISADSRQVYRELTTGTAKPSASALASVPHHFINERSLGEPWSAGQFAEEANRRIAGILERGRVPLIVGGSTLYLTALIHGLASVPKGDPAIRHALNRQVSTPAGAAELYSRLKQIDPSSAARLDPTKTQRLVRAIEVFQTTGRPMSSFLRDVAPPPYRYQVIVQQRPRAELYKRIDDRVDHMISKGLIDENRQLRANGWRPDTNPLRTIGYTEPFAYLQGEIDEEEMVRLIKRNTRRYAKRQQTWLRARFLHSITEHCS